MSSIQVLSFIMSGITIATMWLLGNKDRRGWILGLVNQALWLVFIVAVEAWGLLLLTACLTVIYARNLWRWWQEEAEPDVPELPNPVALVYGDVPYVDHTAAQSAAYQAATDTTLYYDSGGSCGAS